MVVLPAMCSFEHCKNSRMGKKKASYTPKRPKFHANRHTSRESGESSMENDSVPQLEERPTQHASSASFAKLKGNDAQAVEFDIDEQLSGFTLPCWRP